MEHILVETVQSYGQNIDADELERADNPLKIDGLLPKPAKTEPSLDDVTSW